MTNGITRVGFINRPIGRQMLSFTLILLMWTLCIPVLPVLNVHAQTADDIWKAKGANALNLSAKQTGNGKVSARMQEFADRSFAKVEGATEGDQLSQPSSRGASYTFANVEFASSKAREAVFGSNKRSPIPGISVLTVFDRFADIFISTETGYEQLIKSPGIVWIDGFRPVSAPPPPPYSTLDAPSKAVPDRIVRGGYQGLKGKNVIVTIVDTGVDFRHPDFITYGSDGKPTSRLLYLWDTGLDYKSGRGNPAPFSFPNAAPTGTLFTQAQLTAELRASTQTIPENDLQGHGTACASIAAGNGNADMGISGLKRGEVVGVAPEADIIGISMDAEKNGGLAGTYLLNAMSEWLDDVAGAKPLVVSNSWGNHWSGHDGQTIFERQLDARYSLSRKGRAILFAAGNEGEDNFHATIQLAADKRVSLSWDSEFASVWLRVYFDTISPDVGVVPRPADMRREINPLSGQTSFELKFPGSGSAVFGNLSDKPVRADLYLPPRDHNFDVPFRNNKGMIGSPGTMRNAITVGSYDWNDNFHLGGRVTVLPGIACLAGKDPLKIGNISCYSSPGPTRDGRQKPEIVAPGQYFTSSHAKVGGQPVDPGYADSTGNYMLMNGTSAATPYTAGIVALMFEKKPDLTFGEVRSLLEKNASKDPFTGIPPGSEWGSGKLDMRAVERIFAELGGV